MAAENGNIRAEINLNRFKGLLLAFDGPFPSKENLLFSSKQSKTSKIVKSTKARILIIVKYSSGSFGINLEEICGGEHYIEPKSDLMVYSPFYPYQNPTPANAKFMFLIKKTNRSYSYLP